MDWTAVSPETQKQKSLICFIRFYVTVSEELDQFQQEIVRDYPAARIIDSHYYGIDTFALCEMNSYILITQPVYEDIHPHLITIPLRTDASMPYGLIYAKEPTIATEKFIQAVKAIASEG